MKILIVGGSGFLSGTIARVALAEGHTVHAVTRGQRTLMPGVTPVLADRKDTAAFKNAIRTTGHTFDLVVDSIGYTANDARQDLDVFSMIAGHLVFVSTDFVYGRPRPWKIDETFDRFETEFPYGRGKREAEQVLLSSSGSMRVTVLRPCHIYGPGSQLGCLPEHGRDPKLLDCIRNGETLKLVGGGYFLQQPVFAPDLARMILSCVKLDVKAPAVFHAAGPEAVESRTFYELIGQIVRMSVKIEEIPISTHLGEKPTNSPFCCHRVYDMTKAAVAGLDVPKTPLLQGLAEHVRSMNGSV